MTRILPAIIAASLLAGCAATGDKQLDMNKLAQMYYGQQTTRQYPSFRVTGANDIHFSGSNMNFEVNTHMEPLNMIPRDPGLASVLIPELAKAAVAGVGIYTAGEVMKGMTQQPRTVDPVIVRPEVVQPQVVTVPQ